MWQRPVLGDVVQLVPIKPGISARHPDRRIKAAVIIGSIGKTDCCCKKQTVESMNMSIHCLRETAHPAVSAIAFCEGWPVSAHSSDRNSGGLNV